MKFYTKQHKHYCGIDLHARSIYLCILNQNGDVLYHRNQRAEAEQFLKAVHPYREDLVVAVECMFCWYWIADLCASEGIPFVLGHALYMKAIHGGKAKNDRIDARKIAALLRGGMIPMAYVYPSEMRSTRDLFRRRMHFMRKRAELLGHIKNTNSQYNLPEIGQRISRRCDREKLGANLIDRFDDASVRKSMEVDVGLLDYYDEMLAKLEWYISQNATIHDSAAFFILQSVPGIGKTLAMAILYEIHSIERFKRVQDFLSYSRLVKCQKESAGKRYGNSGAKMGNAYLKWAFSEAAVLFLKGNKRRQKFLAKLEKKHGKGKALSILAAKIGRAVYFMLRRNHPFDEARFLAC
ncbi:MAG: IS110 family transposase [Thermodesulfobacteriota bacterium]